MAKKPLDRPDLTWPNARVADAIANDGTHFFKHGVQDFGLQTPAEYSQFIKDALNNENTFGFAARAPSRYLAAMSGKTPEFSIQTFYDPDRNILVTTHLKRDLSGKMTVNGTAHPAQNGERTYHERMEKSAREGNHSLIELEKDSNYFKALAKRGMGGRDAIVATKFSQLAPNMMRKIFSHFGLVGAGMAAGLTKFFGGSTAEAMQAAADATPGLRIATSPNSHEKAVRTFDAYTAGFGEEPVRYVNDVIKSFGHGDPQIADGVVREGARLVGTAIRDGYDAAFGPKEMLPPLPSDIEQVINPGGATKPQLLSTSDRSRQPLNAITCASLPLAPDGLPKAANADTIRQSTAQVAAPLLGTRQRMAP